MSETAYPSGDDLHATTLYPLSEAQIGLLRSNLYRYEPPPGRWVGLPHPARVVLVLWRTGAHPSLLANPGKFGLRVADGAVEWMRAKTRKPARVPLHVDIAEWAADFFRSLPVIEKVVPSTEGLTYLSRSGREMPRAPIDLGYQVYSEMVRHVGQFCGIPGLSPRTLRHQFIAEYLDAAERVLPLTAALQRVSEDTGTSVATLFNYRRRRSVGSVPEIAEGRWGLAPPPATPSPG